MLGITKKISSFHREDAKMQKIKNQCLISLRLCDSAVKLDF